MNEMERAEFEMKQIKDWLASEPGPGAYGSDEVLHAFRKLHAIQAALDWVRWRNNRPYRTPGSQRFSYFFVQDPVPPPSMRSER